MKIAVITNHLQHVESDSIYELVTELDRLPYVKEIIIVSLGCVENSQFYATPTQGEIYGKLFNQEFQFCNRISWYRNCQVFQTNEFDALLLRLDRPVSDGFLFALKKSLRNDCIIVNDTDGIIKTGSKEFLLQVSHLCPDIALCKNLDDVKKMAESYPIVLKPLDNYGGQGLIRIDGKLSWHEAAPMPVEDIYELLDTQLSESKPMLGMKFLKNVANGDKRVLIVDGVVLGATLRIPKQGSWLANLKQGATTEYVEPNEEELTIANELHPIMHQNGVVIYGFDTLEDDDGVRVLSEINTLNVGGFIQAQEHAGRPIVAQAAKGIWNYINEKYHKEKQA